MFEALASIPTAVGFGIAFAALWAAWRIWRATRKKEEGGGP